jgi:hypothetical protein
MVKTTLEARIRHGYVLSTDIKYRSDRDTGKLLVTGEAASFDQRILKAWKDAAEPWFQTELEMGSRHDLHWALHCSPQSDVCAYVRRGNCGAV